jgi:transcription elongation factor Elf1
MQGRTWKRRGLTREERTLFYERLGRCKHCEGVLEVLKSEGDVRLCKCESCGLTQSRVFNLLPNTATM